MGIEQNETRHAAGAGGFDDCSCLGDENGSCLGDENGSCLGGENGSDPIAPRPENQPPCSPADGIRLGMIRRELFAESITIALGFGLNSLHAAQQGDDATAIGDFRCFRIAAQTAESCVRDIREIIDGSRT